MINAKKTRFLTKIYIQINKYQRKRKAYKKIDKDIKFAIKYGKDMCNVRFYEYYLCKENEDFLMKISTKYKRKGFLCNLKEMHMGVSSYYYLTIDWSKDNDKQR